MPTADVGSWKEVHIEKLGRQLHRVRGRASKLVAELLLKVSLAFVWLLDEAVIEVIDDRSGPDRDAWGEERIVGAEGRLDPALGCLVDTLRI